MPEDYIVRAGDCINSIAFERGFFWETLWGHPKNAELKSKRRNPNILKEGDVVHIPDLTIKEESRATEGQHHFKLKGAAGQITFTDHGRTRAANTPASRTGGARTKFRRLLP
ncbi:MAG: hypothetical protein WKF84_20390 [Pyrinomonadaceae bacterium]